MELASTHTYILSAITAILTVVFIYVLIKFAPNQGIRKYLFFSFLPAITLTLTIWLLIKGNTAEFGYLLLLIWPFLWLIDNQVIKSGSNKDKSK